MQLFVIWNKLLIFFKLIKIKGMNKIIYIIFAALILTSCQKMQNKMGLTTTGPDEYQVQRSKALEVPPHYDLPDPYKTHHQDDAHSGKEYDNLSDSEKAILKEVK